MHTYAELLRQTALKFGPIVRFNVHLDVREYPDEALFSELQAAGASLIHCPSINGTSGASASITRTFFSLISTCLDFVRIYQWTL